MRNKVEFKCPHCGTEQAVILENKEYELFRCDIEVGGCDKPLVAHQSTVTLYTASIQGVGPVKDYYEALEKSEREQECHSVLNFGAFLLDKSIHALRCNHYFGYSFHPILREFSVEIYLGGWQSNKDADYEIRDIKVKDVDALQKAIADITAVLERKEATNG